MCWHQKGVLHYHAYRRDHLSLLFFGAFAQIIRSNTLWLTDMFSTNDREEHRYFRRLACEIIKAEKQQPSEQWKEATPRLLRTTHIDIDETGEIYFACSLAKRILIDIGVIMRVMGMELQSVSVEYLLARQQEMGRDYLEEFNVEYDVTEKKSV